MEIQSLRQSVIRKMIGWRSLNGAMRRRQTARQRVGLQFESVRKVLDAQIREHRPGIAIGWCLDDGCLQRLPSWDEFLRRRTLQVTEAAQHGLIGAQLIGRAAAHESAEAAGQDPMQIRYSRYNAGS